MNKKRNLKKISLVVLGYFLTTTISETAFAGTPRLTSISMNPVTAIIGDTVTATIKMDQSCSGTCAVDLKSSSTAASVPGSVTILNGSTSATFSFAAGTVTVATPISITGTYNTRSVSSSGFSISPAGVVVNPPPPPSSGGLTNTASASVTGEAARDPSTFKNMAIRDMYGSIAIKTVPYNVTGLYELCRLAFPGTGQLTAAGPIAQSQAASGALYVTYTASQSWSCASGAYTGWLNSFVVTFPRFALYSGDVATGEACLKEAAPAGGVVVQIKSINGRTAPPTSMTIASGSLCGKFTFLSAGTAGTELMSVSVNGFSKFTTFDAFP